MVLVTVVAVIGASAADDLPPGLRLSGAAGAPMELRSTLAEDGGGRRILAPLAPAAHLTIDTALRQSLVDSAAIGVDDERQTMVESELRGAVDAFLPSVSLVYTKVLGSHYTYDPIIPGPSSGPDSVARGEADSFGIQATLPLFDGFKRWNNLAAARLRVAAGRHLSIDARQQVMLEAATAYLAVRRDRAILAHRHAQAAALDTVLERSKTQYSTHDATRSDVSLSFSRLMAARIAIRQAEASLARSEADLRRLTGGTARSLAAPRPVAALLPRSVEDLRRAMLGENPRLAALGLQGEAAEYAAKAAMAELSPRVDLDLLHGRQWNLSQYQRGMSDTTVRLSVKIPIWEPGTLPKLEGARAYARQQVWSALDAKRKAAADAEALFVEHQALGTELGEAGRRIEAMRAAVASLRVEQSAGYRTVIDVLDAESELGDAAALRETIAFERERVGYTIAAALARLGDGATSTRPAPSLMPWGGLLASTR